MACLLGAFCRQVGFGSLVRLYIVPYLVSTTFFVLPAQLLIVLGSSLLITVSFFNLMFVYQFIPWLTQWLKG